MKLSGGHPATIQHLPQICLVAGRCITTASISENQAIFKVVSWHYQKTTLKKKFKKSLAKPNAMLQAFVCLFVLMKRKRKVKLFSKISHNMHSCIHTPPPHFTS